MKVFAYTITEVNEADRRLSMRLSDYRRANRLTIIQMALMVGTNAQTLGRIERLLARPVLENVKRIEAVLAAPYAVSARAPEKPEAPAPRDALALAAEHEARVKETRRLQGMLMQLGHRVAYLEAQLGVAWKPGTSPSAHNGATGTEDTTP